MYQCFATRMFETKQVTHRLDQYGLQTGHFVDMSNCVQPIYQTSGELVAYLRKTC